MEIHGMKNNVICAIDTLPAYSDIVAATGYQGSFQDWLKDQNICCMCGEGIEGPCPHQEDEKCDHQ